MIFHFEMSSNDVRRNTDFVAVLSSQYATTSKPICDSKFRRAVTFYTIRSSGLVDPRLKKNWSITSDLYLKPKESN
jgi:hypothetical protein